MSCNVKFSQWETQKADTEFLICDTEDKHLAFHIDFFKAEITSQNK